MKICKYVRLVTCTLYAHICHICAMFASDSLSRWGWAGAGAGLGSGTVTGTGMGLGLGLALGPGTDIEWPTALRPALLQHGP